MENKKIDDIELKKEDIDEKLINIMNKYNKCIEDKCNLKEWAYDNTTESDMNMMLNYPYMDSRLNHIEPEQINSNTLKNSSKQHI
jgi:hypothetical protein